MGELGINHFLLLSATLFIIGMMGVLIRRNILIIFMCVELMINAVNLTLVAFADYLPNAGGLGVSYAVLVIAIAAAEIAVGLAIALAVFRSRRTVNVDEVNSMRG
jgi:NADH:ubiquinone oxidoreductase subunit K